MSAGHLKPHEMRCAKLFGLLGRVKRIAEADEAGDAPLGVQLVGDETCHPPAHGFAADQQRRTCG